MYATLLRCWMISRWFTPHLGVMQWNRNQIFNHKINPQPSFTLLYGADLLYWSWERGWVDWSRWVWRAGSSSAPEVSAADESAWVTQPAGGCPEPLDLFTHTKKRPIRKWPYLHRTNQGLSIETKTRDTKLGRNKFKKLKLSGWFNTSFKLWEICARITQKTNILLQLQGGPNKFYKLKVHCFTQSVICARRLVLVQSFAELNISNADAIRSAMCLVGGLKWHPL